MSEVEICTWCGAVQEPGRRCRHVTQEQAVLERYRSGDMTAEEAIREIRVLAPHVPRWRRALDVLFGDW